MSSRESGTPQPLPPYSYVPGGRWPHPTSSPLGHLHGRLQGRPPAIEGDAWSDSEAYLRASRCSTPATTGRRTKHGRRSGTRMDDEGRRRWCSKDSSNWQRPASRFARGVRPARDLTRVEPRSTSPKRSPPPDPGDSALIFPSGSSMRNALRCGRPTNATPSIARCIESFHSILVQILCRNASLIDSICRAC